ncbi:MAG: hypothetical protein KDJ39_11810 [Gammaproteobacteria bacterium]|nr:hypothetical protein [Gammaproteobacteria bacterium]
MRQRLLPLLFVFLSARALAFEFPIEVTEYLDDVRISAYINKADLAAAPHWEPFTEALPLSVDGALAAVQQFMREKEQVADAELLGIELKRIPRHEAYWHYLVRIRSASDDKSKPHLYVVLLDGKVIAAIREPQSIK